MNEQGVLHGSKQSRLLIHILLLFTSCLPSPANAETAAADEISHEKIADRKHVFIIHTADNELETSITTKVAARLMLERPDIEVIEASAQKNTREINNETDLIIGIGTAGIDSADTNYPEINKLFIATDPNNYRLNKSKNKADAVLYMTQPYCRQLRFINLLNRDWSTISILSSLIKPIDRKAIQQCSNNYDLKIYIVTTSEEDNTSDKIRHALHHSDVLMAMPDSKIYNSNTVKNILLTSYRYRKPVIGFSSNFVAAGALAAVYSDTDQIAQSTTDLIERYYDSGMRFSTTENYPENFNIKVNRQVFKALDLSMPDIETLRQSLEHDEEGLQR